MKMKLAIILPEFFVLMFCMNTMVQAAAAAVPHATPTPVSSPVINKAAPSSESPKASIKRQG